MQLVIVISNLAGFEVNDDGRTCASKALFDDFANATRRNKKVFGRGAFAVRVERKQLLFYVFLLAAADVAKR